ncbi:Fc receptor-like protein 5 isoform X2 [Centroberyx affinis]|uniref:Fc receptor-like protein 5 isoform X2 n=1 Tax=Centroberyx affinis TaxID=166261 RepID=UPI003A5C10B1
MKILQIFHLLAVLASASLVLKISGSVSLYPVLAGPDKAYLGSKVAFQCIAPGSSPPITYVLMKDSNVPITTGTDLQGDQPATFFFKVAGSSEGSYSCRATAGGDTGVSSSIRLLVVTPVSGTRLTSEPFPPVAYEGSRLVLSCDVTRGSHLSYTWFFNRREVTSSALPLLRPAGNKLVVEKVTSEHAGKYSCMAGTSMKENSRFSSSEEVQVTVKVHFSTPSISFTLSKEGDNYSGNVTCWSSSGSPPVTFYLLLDDKEAGSVTATESLVAWFPVAMVPGRDMGVAQCRAQNDVQQLLSEPLTLEVVPVGGRAKVEVEHLYTADSKMSAVRLHCQLSRGTFPYFTWLFNDSLLPTETHPDSHIPPLVPNPHYAFTDQRRTLILPGLGPEESGYYRCRARDSYDDSGPWVESAAELVRVTGSLTACPEQLPTSSTATPPKVSFSTIELITITLCGFMFLTLVGAVACVIRMFDRKQANVRTNATTNLGALPLSTTTSQSEGRQMDTSDTDSDVQNQTMEITV